MTIEEIFFKELLSETKTAFLQSPVYNKQKALGQAWNYSVCGTPVQIGKGIILGINWGANGFHSEQTEMPDGKDIISYNFIMRSRPFLERFLSLDFSHVNFNYTNLCFFRTPNIDFLTIQDYKYSLPLFEKLVKFISPEWILSLGYNNCKVLFGNKDLQILNDSKDKYKAVKAKLWGYDFYAVPHPNARVKAELRNELWRCIGQQRINDIKQDV